MVSSKQAVGTLRQVQYAFFSTLMRPGKRFHIYWILVIIKTNPFRCAEDFSEERLCLASSTPNWRVVILYYGQTWHSRLYLLSTLVKNCGAIGMSFGRTTVRIVVHNEALAGKPFWFLKSTACINFRIGSQWATIMLSSRRICRSEKLLR